MFRTVACLLFLCSLLGLPPLDKDALARQKIRTLITDVGLSDTLTIRREEDKVFPEFPPWKSNLVFFEIYEGGPFEKDGERHYRLVDHPRRWRVFVDLNGPIVYRLFGFPSGNDFAKLVRDVGSEHGKVYAERLCESFVEFSYAVKAVPVKNEFELRRFIEDNLYDLVDSKTALDLSKRFLLEHGKDIRRELGKVGIREGNDQYVVSVLVAKGVKYRSHDAQIEIRNLKCLLSDQKGFEIIEKKK